MHKGKILEANKAMNKEKPKLSMLCISKEEVEEQLLGKVDP